MVAILFFFSIFLLSPDSEFVEASPAPYNPEELGKSAPSPVFSNSSRKPRVLGGAQTKSAGGAEGKNQRSLPGPHVPFHAKTDWPFLGACALEWRGKCQLCRERGARSAGRAVILLQGARPSKLPDLGPR